MRRPKINSELRSLQWKTDQVKGRALKINQVKEYVSKNDQVPCIRIAVDRFLKRTLSLVFWNTPFNLMGFVLVGPTWFRVKKEIQKRASHAPFWTERNPRDLFAYSEVLRKNQTRSFRRYRFFILTKMDLIPLNVVRPLEDNPKNVSSVFISSPSICHFLLANNNWFAFAIKASFAIV